MFSDEIKRLWGFHPQQEAFYNTYLEENQFLLPARVMFSSHKLYRVRVLGAADERIAKVRGHFYSDKRDLPVVGDWVTVELSPGDHEHLPITEVLPRRSSLERPDYARGKQTLLANANAVVLVTSFNDDLNLRRLERGVAMIEDGGAKPVIVVNKYDLVNVEQATQIMNELSERFREVQIFAVSAHKGVGLVELTDSIHPGQSIAFLGMSGVGKSTLVNAILGSDKLETSAIREEDSRGRHTTTHRELVQTSHGFWLLDSPGLREFSLTDEGDGLDRTFQDLADLMMTCRFGDCSHDTEPGCAIKAALESGSISADRWQNYLKMKREAEFHVRKRDGAFLSERKKAWAKRATEMRQRVKAKDKK